MCVREWCARLRVYRLALRRRRNMRVARQHPLHLQVPRPNNGKFLVGPSHGQDHVHQPQQHSPPASDEASAVPPVVFPSCEPVPHDLHGGPTILGDRFLLLGPAEGSALYRCVDVQSGKQLVAKVSIRAKLPRCDCRTRSRARLAASSRLWRA